MKVYSLEYSEGWGENHRICALFASLEARERFLSDPSHVVTESPEPGESWWYGWHDVLTIENEVRAESQAAVIEAVLAEARLCSYEGEYEVIE